ncbi:MAG: hypothetical protein KAT17_03595 [Candidatus Aminicenantes bacterium]|nr:hypothetical protein [Candidatus Aminicenantes bacterium]
MNKHHCLSLVLFMLLIAISCNQPTVIEYVSGPIDTSSEPIQELLAIDQSFTMNKGKGNYTIKPVARYQISARVVSVKSYSSGWESTLSSIDLALVWGDLADPKLDNTISYRQQQRWYYYRYSPACPVNKTYIINHSCNNHMIPSSDNIHRALKSIKKNDRVKIEGYLVNISGTVGRKNVWWNTSTTRSDSGDHSCEIIYVKKLRVNKKVYL